MFESGDLFLVIKIIATLAATGALAGFMSGLLGIGGGLITVPVLTSFFLTLDVSKSDAAHLAVATSLAAIIPTSYLSFRAHRAKGAVDKELLKRWLPWLALGAVFGSLLAGRVPAQYLQVLFACNSLYFAYRFWSDQHDISPKIVPMSPFVQHVLVFAIGMASAMLGIGGGMFGVMLMMSLGLPIHVAVASAAAFGVTSAIPGTVVYAFSPGPLSAIPFGSVGLVHPVALFLLLLGAVFMPTWGARMAHRWKPKRLKRAFAILMVILAGKMILLALT